jgi:cytoskeletal protein RodZ
MSTFLIFVVIALLVATGIGFVVVGKENTPTEKKPNSFFPVEDYPSFEDAPVAEEKPFTEHTQSAKKKKRYYSDKTKSTKKPKQVKTN